MPPSALARPLDLKVPSNRFALAGFLGSFLIAKALGRPTRAALGSGMSAFLAWSTARELHPDQPRAANLALVLEGALAQAEGGNVWSALALNQAARVLSGTVGLPATALDAASLAGLALLSAASGARVAALAPTCALLLSASVNDRLSPPRDLAGLAALGWLGALVPKPAQSEAPLAPGVLGALLALGTVGKARVGQVQSLQDKAPQPVSAERVRLARILTLGVLAASALAGEPLRNVSPIWAAWLVTAWDALFWHGRPARESQPF